jgi:hypothetical protein
MFLAAVLLWGWAQNAAAGTTPAPQTAAAVPVVADPTALVRKALDMLDRSANDEHRFTYTLDLKMAVQNPYGRLGPVQWLTYDVLYINDLPYEHLVRTDGAPLTGKDLADEKKRYDKAIAKKKDLGEKKRASADGYKLVKEDMSLESVLSPTYQLKSVAEHKTDVGMVDEIDATLLPGMKHSSKCAWHFQLFVGETDGVLYRFRADTPTDTSAACVGESEDVTFQVVDGLPKPKMESGRINVDEGYGYFASLNTARYSDYKRFHSTVTLGVPEVLPETPVGTSAPATKP